MTRAAWESPPDSAFSGPALGRVAMPAYSHLLDEERDQIAVMRAAGRSIWAIARALQRAKSTVSRELRRNGLSSRYSPLHAAGAYQLRRRREAIIEKDQKLRTFVCDRLAEGWTPEQIAGWLKAGNERRLRAVGCETIYAFIYRPYQKAERLWRYLTRRHKRRRPRRSRPSRDTIKDRVSIHEQPRAGPEKAESGGDSQAARVMIHPAGWEEASLDGKTLFAGFAGTHDVGCSFRTVSTRGGADVRCQRELCDQAHAAG